LLSDVNELAATLEAYAGPKTVFVWDVGNVLLHIKLSHTRRSLANLLDRCEERVDQVIMHGDLQQQFSRGLITPEYFLSQVGRQLELGRIDVDAFWETYCDLGAFTAAATLELARELSQRSMGCYILSDVNPAHLSRGRARYPDMYVSFAGVFNSCEINATKKQPEAFRHVHERLPKAEQVVFTDDIESNLRRARETVGWIGVHFCLPEE
jgi:FMN phosphatase YigB (HAD superfamily)